VLLPREHVAISIAELKECISINKTHAQPVRP
jgi:hypothetical protein